MADHSENENPAGPNEDPRSREQKLFAGAQIRRLRRERGLTQARMAAELGISPSYQNLIERNQRPLSAQILIKLAAIYELDVGALAADGESAALATLRETFADPLFAALPVPAQEQRDLAAISPSAAQAIGVLYRTYREAAASISTLAEQIGAGDEGGGEGRANGPAARFPVEEVRDLFHERNNHFPQLDQAAEELAEEIGLAGDEPASVLRRYIEREEGLRVRVVPRAVMGGALRRYNYHERTVFLSDMLDPMRRNFQLAYQIGLFRQHALIGAMTDEAGLSSDESRAICRIGLTSYFAGALLMPYERFHAAADELRHDIDALSRRFGASFEQVCHRLTTLSRPGLRGIPFFLIRLDSAGNITKRFSAGGFPFAHTGGACPRWNVHDTFRLPGRILRQIIEMEDGRRYFSIASTITRPGSGYPDPDQLLSIGLGCELSHASRLIYADGFDVEAPSVITPIGINCRLCERPDCAQRAFPPIGRPLRLDESVRGASAFNFSLE